MTVVANLLDHLESLHADAFSWAVTCSGGDADAGADALQEAYVKVVTGRTTFGGRSALKTWWFGVVRLTVLEQQRRTHRWRRVADDFVNWISTFGAESPECEETGAIAPPDAEWLAAAMKQLPARQSEILSLIFQQELSLSEAAVVMGVSVGSARQHYDRAKKKLRSALHAAATTSACDHAT